MPRPAHPTQRTRRAERTQRAQLLRDVAALSVAALVARVVGAWLVGHPPFTDAAYYTLVAERLATGQGFSVPVLWSFLEVGGRLPSEPTLPVPSNGHWMPLTSIVAAAGMVLFGEGWRAGQVPIVVLGAALVPATYLIGRELWGSRRKGLLAGVLAIFAGPFLVMYPLIDNFAVFGVAGASALYAAVRAVRSADPRHAGWWLGVAGAAVGVATLARIDGLMLAAAPAVAWLLRPDVGLRAGRDERDERDERRVNRWARRLAWGGASAAACLLVVAPWLLRNLEAFGAPLPSAGGHLLWITDYNEQFTISRQPSVSDFVAWGLPNIVGSRLASWGDLMGRTTMLTGGIFVVGLLFGLWRERRRRDLAPFIAYFVVMFVTMGGLFTFHAPMGAYYHSAPAWLPFALPMAVANLPHAAGAAGRVWPFLRRSRAQAFLLYAGLAGAIVLSGVGSAILVAQWTDAHRKLSLAGEFLSANAAGQRVLAYDPAALYLISGNPGVAPPFDPYRVVAEVVDAYELRWVVVTLRPGQGRDPLGLWHGGAPPDGNGERPTFLGPEPAFEAPGVRVFEVGAP